MVNFQATTKTQNHAKGYIILVAGILCIVVSAIIVVPAIQTQSPPVNWAPILGIAGVIVAIAGCIQIYDSRPLPNEPLHAPLPVQLVRDELWRANSGLRFLESLKEELIASEDDLVRTYERAKEAYEKLPLSSGRIEYYRLRSQKSYAEVAMPSLQKQIATLKQRIDNIVSGNVEPEILTLKERIQKLERANQENQMALSELDKPCTLNHDPEQCKRDHAHKRAQFRSYIHTNDNAIIELKTQQEELKNYDFKNLWKGLGHSAAAGAGLRSVDKEQLRDMKDKADILQAMPSLRPVAPKPAPEEERRKKEVQAEARLKRHEQNKRDALERILLGRQFNDLPSDDQDEYKREENTWSDTLRQDRDELRKIQR